MLVHQEQLVPVCLLVLLLARQKGGMVLWKVCRQELVEQAWQPHQLKISKAAVAEMLPRPIQLVSVVFALLHLMARQGQDDLVLE